MINYGGYGQYMPKNMSYGGNSFGGQPTTNFQNQYNTLSHNYNQDAGKLTGNLAANGMFGSSNASSDFGNLNYNLGQAQASYANQQANQEFSNTMAGKQLGLQGQAQKFNQQQKLYEDAVAKAQAEYRADPQWGYDAPQLPQYGGGYNSNAFGGGW